MLWGFDAAHDELRTVVRSFFARHCGEADVRRFMATGSGHDLDMWRRMADQLGVAGLVIPEKFGGSGYTARELGVVLEEAGRALACAPLLSTTVLATGALLATADEAAQADHLPGIAAGQTVATVALPAPGPAGEPRTGIRGERSARGWLLDGEAPMVLDGLAAQLLLVPAWTDAGLSLFAVTDDASGLTRAPLESIDSTRKLARVRFEQVPTRLIGPEGSARAVLARVREQACVALAAEQTGGAQRCLEMAVEYAKARVQFGRVIGSFQAIKHLCADLMVEVEAARAVAYRALAAAADGEANASTLATLARITCSETYTRVAGENIQIHGGIGFTWEHPAHLYFKRAKVSEALLGHPDWHRRALGHRVELAVAKEHIDVE